MGYLCLFLIEIVCAALLLLLVYYYDFIFPGMAHLFCLTQEKVCLDVNYFGNV